MTTNESTPLYRDGRHYDALNSDLVADIAFYVEEARKAAGLVDSHPPAKSAGRAGQPQIGNSTAEFGCSGRSLYFSPILFFPSIMTLLNIRLIRVW